MNLYPVESETPAIAVWISLEAPRQHLVTSYSLHSGAPRGATHASLQEFCDAPEVERLAQTIRDVLSSGLPQNNMMFRLSPFGTRMEHFRVSIRQQSQTTVRLWLWPKVVAHQENKSDILASEFKTALSTGKLEVRYQPIFSLKVKRFTGVEALVRWRHPKWGPLNAAEFISTLKAHGLLPELTLAMLDAVLADVRKENVFRSRGLTVFVNIDAQEFADEDQRARVVSKIELIRAEGVSLVVEVNEMNFEGDSTTTTRIFRDQGIDFAFDDFSGGHSALPRLLRQSPRFLKFDKMMTRMISASEKSDAVIFGLMRLIQAMGSEVIAEGVETLGQLYELDNHECDLVQGYYVARPGPVHTLERAMKKFCQSNPTLCLTAKISTRDLTKGYRKSTRTKTLAIMHQTGMVD